MNQFQAYRLPLVPTHFHFSPECEPCIARLLGGTPDGPATGWPADVDSAHIVQGLEWHRIGPVLYQQAKTHGELNRLPAWLREYLHESYVRWTAVNLARQAELVRLIAAIGRAGVPVILLKGAALLQGTYTAVGLRPMVDVDLMVRFHDLDRMRAVLCPNGYREIPRLKNPDHEHHLQFKRVDHRSPGFCLEVHWRLSDQDALDELLPVNDLWGRSISASPPFAPARVLDVCDRSLHAALHLAEHFGLPQLRWLCDLHLLARELDSVNDAWATLARRAVACNLQLVLAASLQETTRWFGTLVPCEFWGVLGAGLPPSPQAVNAFAQCRQPDLVQFELRELRAIRTLRGRLEHLRSLLFPSASFIRRRECLSRSPLIWPYRLMRLARGIRTGARYIFSRAGGRSNRTS